MPLSDNEDLRDLALSSIQYRAAPSLGGFVFDAQSMRVADRTKFLIYKGGDGLPGTFMSDGTLFIKETREDLFILMLEFALSGMARKEGSNPILIANFEREFRSSDFRKLTVNERTFCERLSHEGPEEIDLRFVAEKLRLSMRKIRKEMNGAYGIAACAAYEMGRTLGDELVSSMKNEGDPLGLSFDCGEKAGEWGKGRSAFEMQLLISTIQETLILANSPPLVFQEKRGPKVSQKVKETIKSGMDSKGISVNSGIIIGNVSEMEQSSWALWEAQKLSGDTFKKEPSGKWLPQKRI